MVTNIPRCSRFQAWVNVLTFATESNVQLYARVQWCFNRLHPTGRFESTRTNLIKIHCGSDYFHVAQAELFALTQHFAINNDTGTAVEVDSSFSIATLLIRVLSTI